LSPRKLIQASEALNFEKGLSLHLPIHGESKLN
jgi:hypothetical protein